MENNELNFGVALVTQSGLYFHNKFYTNSYMIRHKWFEQAEKEGEWLISVFYHPSNPRELILFDYNSMEIATLVDLFKTNEELESYYSQIQVLKNEFFQRSK